MDVARIRGLHAARKLTEHQRDVFLEWAADPGTDPCLKGGAPGLVRLWYSLVPNADKRGAAVARVRELVYARGTSFVHKQLASKLGADAQAKNAALERFLSAWLALTEEPAVLEAAAWTWLAAAGASGGDHVPASALTARARADPLLFARRLVAFRRETGVRVDAAAAVDAVARANDWWDDASAARTTCSCSSPSRTPSASTSGSRRPTCGARRSTTPTCRRRCAGW